MTVGDRMGSYNGFIAYQNSQGPLQWLILRGDNVAFTPGNIAFHRDEFSRGDYWHEYRHFQQSKFMGPAYLPIYLVVNAAVLGNEGLHPMEIDANRYERGSLERKLPWE